MVTAPACSPPEPASGAATTTPTASAATAAWAAQLRTDRRPMVPLLLSSSPPTACLICGHGARPMGSCRGTPRLGRRLDRCEPLAKLNIARSSSPPTTTTRGGPDDTFARVGPGDPRRRVACDTRVRPTRAGAVLLGAWFRPDHDV